MERSLLVKEWIAKLRSGEVKQGHGFLGNTSGYRCCLGVACDIAVEHGIIAKPTIRPNIRGEGVILVYDGKAASLPSSVKQAFGLVTSNGQYDTDSHRCSNLIDLNDTSKMTFAEIADVIESAPQDLFIP